ncbi:MAG: type VI secretion system baseplate subunit TssE [Planctomycetes bacterium]|nr:type VI secretion system baseplate subunit TssE [Planctomycetota bacterium]
MLRSITLLERLNRAAVEGGVRTVKEDRGAVMRSVLLNLQRLLNTRQGSAAAQPDLGLPSPHEMLIDYPASVEQAQRAVKLCIQRYEPRLSNVVVSIDREEGQKQVLSFAVSAQLAGGDRRDPISFHTAITPDGRIRLRDA